MECISEDLIGLGIFMFTICFLAYVGLKALTGVEK